LTLAARSVQRGADFVGFVAVLSVAALLSRFGTRVAVTFCVDAKKRCIVALETENAAILGGRIHKRRSGCEMLPAACGRIIRRLLKQCEARGVRLYVWGYADKQFFGLSFSEFAKTSRLETGLFGVGARYNASEFSYVIDTRVPYFDGRAASDLENMLSATKSGAWKSNPRASQFISSIARSDFQKYAEINQNLDVAMSGNDVVIVGQCEGDAAWIETDSMVLDNVHLVEEAAKLFSGAEVYYKPHPFNRTNVRDISEVQRRDLARVIAPEISFAQIAAKRPVIVVNTSGAGLEAALRGCKVHTFGTSYYSHWGFTTDRTACARRSNRLTAEDVFYVLVFNYCKYGQRTPLIRLSAERVTQSPA
jgi:capsular polysaccharide export protein